MLSGVSFIRALPNHFVWRAALFASMGSLLAGYYDGSMNGILEMEGFHSTFHQLYNHHREVSSDEESLLIPNDTADIDTDTSMTANNTHTCSSGNGASSDILIGLMVSISNLGSAGGSLLAGWLSDQFSRKCGLLISGLVVMAGSILLSASFHVWTFVMGRGLCGIGIGIIYMVMPVYISEISPRESRGMMTSLIGPGYALGVLTGLCTNVGFSRFHLGWRVATVIQGLLGLLFSVGAKWIPQTPRWLVMQHREKEARCVLAKINQNSQRSGIVDTYVELEELCASVGPNAQQSKCGLMLKELFQSKYLGRLFLVVLLFVIFAATGNFLYFFTSTLFCEVGVPPFFTALAVGLIVLLASIILLFTIDRIGRKATLLLGSSVNFVLAMFTASLILVYRASNLKATISVVVLICVYAFSTSLTWLTVPWIVNSEVFPINIRGLTVAVSTCSYWAFTFLINQLTPLILGSAIQIHGFFYIVAGINLFAIFFVTFALPETKGVSLEQMDKLFSRSCLKSLHCSSYPVVDEDSQSKYYWEAKELEALEEIKIKEYIHN